MSLIDMSYINLDLEIVCEDEFQRQMSLTDGKLFIYTKPDFKNVNLMTPSIDAQIILNCFSNSGCPLSQLRFSNSLYHHQGANWPIRSLPLAIHYALDAIDTILCMKLDKSTAQTIQKIEHSKEFVGLIFLVQHFIVSTSTKRGYCPEVVEYINSIIPSTVHE